MTCRAGWLAQALRTARAGALLGALAAALAGCSSLKGAPPPADFGNPDYAGPAGPRPGVEILAPSDLADLLGRHLDLARIDHLTGGEPIDDTEWQRLISAAPAQARQLLQTEGYFAPVVTVERVDAASSSRRVRVRVDPGPRVRVAEASVAFAGEIAEQAAQGDEHAQATQEALRRNWPMPRGTPFRNPDWGTAKAKALAQLRAAGYAAASWQSTAADIDPVQHEARLLLVADSGPLFRFGGLAIDGLVTQEPETVEHLAAFAPGEPMTETALADFQLRLQQSGLYDAVTVTLDPDPAQAAQARVQVQLHEATQQVWTFGVGYSDNTGPRASVEHIHRRVFGEALTLHNKIVLGGLERLWTGELSTHPGERMYRNLLGGGIDRLESDTDIVTTMQVRLGRTQDTQRIERLYFVQAERSDRETKDATPENSHVTGYSVNYHGVWRDLDSIVLPTEGFSFSGQAGTGWARGSDAQPGPYLRLYARFTGYLPIGRSWYGIARLEAGSVIKSDKVDVPDGQLFRAGGDESVRGYAYRTLAPTDADGVVRGGSQLLTASVELDRPLSAKLPQVWGAVFVDAGRAVDDWRDYTPALGYGVGVRWRSPVGPLRVDWAWGEETRRGRIHFSVGIAF